jgi:hypothetical protein
MNTTGLYDAFRSDVVDTVRPYLWTDDDVFRYMADAHRMFVRLTGGIPDVSSDACGVDLTAGEATSELHPSLLRILSATLVSAQRPLKAINYADLPKYTENDYGLRTALMLDNEQGEVRYMLYGQQKRLAKWLKVPVINDTVKMQITRMPLSIVTGADQEIFEIDEDHHIHLLDWMKSLAYLKQDVETFDKSKAEDFELRFRKYCAQVTREWGQYKHKTRVVAYGGL